MKDTILVSLKFAFLKVPFLEAGIQSMYWNLEYVLQEHCKIMH